MKNRHLYLPRKVKKSELGPEERLELGITESTNQPQKGNAKPAKEEDQKDAKDEHGNEKDRKADLKKAFKGA